MKVLLASIIPLVACLLLPPSKFRAKGSIVEERRKRESYVLNATHSVDGYRKDNNVVIVRVYPQNNAGKKVEVTGDIIPSVVLCKPGQDEKSNGGRSTGKRATIDCSSRREPKNAGKRNIKRKEKRSVQKDYFKGLDNLKRICQICKDIYNSKFDSGECFRGENGAREVCKEMVKEMPNAVARKWKESTGK